MSAVDVANLQNHPLRKPCRKCGGQQGYIKENGVQDTLWCWDCHTFQYNAPRTETGKAVRTIATVHEGIRPNQRARILVRDGRCCVLCHRSDVRLEVGHLLSVKKGMAQGLTEIELNDDENLAAMCCECNSGLKDIPVPFRICIALFAARVRNEGGKLPDPNPLFNAAQENQP